MEFIIAITGKRLSGKTTAADYIGRKYRFVVLDYTRNVLLPLLMREGKTISRKNLSDMATRIRLDNGNDMLTRIICEHVREGRNYVISGLRFPEEAEYLRSRYGNKFRLISIQCSDRIRYERIMSGSDKEDSRISFGKFMEMENLPTEKPIPKTMELADFTIVNEGSEKELEKKIDMVMEQIQS